MTTTTSTTPASQRLFTLDFSGRSGVPSQLGIDVAWVAKAFREQIKDLHGTTVLNNVVITDAFRKRGVFNVSARTREAAAVLEDFVLKVEKGRTKTTIPMRRRKSDKPATWVKFYQSMEGEMVLVGDQYFDAKLRDYGCVIVQETVSKEHDDASGIFNGVREALVEIGSRHLPRFNKWTSDTGVEYTYKIVYRQQPFDCRQCGEEHRDGQCPRWKPRSGGGGNRGRRNAAASTVAATPPRILLFGDSIMRMLKDDDAMRIDAIPGARIGHVANHINNDPTILPHGEIVIVSVGRNNNGRDFDDAREAAKFQLEELQKVLTPFNNGDRSIFLVDPFVGEISHGPEYDYRRFIRAEMKRTAAKIGCPFVDLEALSFAPEDLDNDGTHYSASGTRKVMGEVRTFVNEFLGKEVIAPFQVAESPYDGCSDRHHKVGCMKCTRLHDEFACPPYDLTASNGDATLTTTAAATPTYAAVVTTSAPSSSTASTSTAVTAPLLSTTATSSPSSAAAAPLAATAQPPQSSSSSSSTGAAPLPSAAPLSAAASQTPAPLEEDAAAAAASTAAASTQDALSSLAGGDEEEVEEEGQDFIMSSQPPKGQRKKRRRRKVVNVAEEAAAPEMDDDTLQGNASWASQVEEEEDEAATAASKLEALTAAEKEEEELAAEIAAEVEEAERAKASAMAEAALFSVSQSFIATSTPTHEKESGKGDLPSSVESGSFILTPEMISCVSSLTGDSTNNNNNSVLINAGVVNSASPSLPSGQVAVFVTPAPVTPTAGTAAAAAAPPELLGAAAAPSPSFQHLSARLQALGSAAMSAYSGSTAPKMPISRLPPRNRSASLKRGRGDETLDEGDVSFSAKRNSSVGKDAKEMPSMSQRELVAFLKQPGQQQQRQSRTPTRGGQKGGKGGL